MGGASGKDNWNGGGLVSMCQWEKKAFSISFFFFFFFFSSFVKYNGYGAFGLFQKKEIILTRVKSEKYYSILPVCLVVDFISSTMPANGFLLTVSLAARNINGKACCLSVWVGYNFG